MKDLGEHRSLSLPWRIAGFLALGGALNYADRATIASVYAVLKTDLHVSDVDIGIIGSVFFWSYAVFSPFAGAIADRYSRSLLVIVSLVAWSMVTGLTGFVGGLITLLALRVALGLSESLYLPSAIALIADHHQTPTRGLAMSILSVGIELGAVLGGTFAGFAAGHFGWRSGFWIMGLVGVTLALAAKPTLKDAPTRLATPGRRPEVLAALRYILSVPSYLILLLMAMLAGIGTWTFFNWLPLYLYETQHLNLVLAGFAGTFVLQFPAATGIAAGGWLSDRLATREVRTRMLLHSTCFLACAPFLLLFLTRPAIGVAMLAIAGFGFLRNLGQSNQNPILCDVIPSQFRSTAVGLMNTCAMAAGGLGILLAGVLKAALGLDNIFASISGVFLLAAGALAIGYILFMRSDIERASANEADQLE